MRLSQLALKTLKETPADAEVISHQLLLRAGMIRKVAAGLYNWLPLGLRVLRRVENIVRDEMNRAGALEVLMPMVQPAELWQESGRWQFYGAELLRFQDRHDRDFCLGPTHEEVITDLVRQEISSYKQLPVNFYQIQSKFRDEIRPRFGLMRGREFIMKDAYSFHLSDDCLRATYQKMYQAYTNIFNRLGLDFRAVQADTGSIGGHASHEFQVLAQAGEDVIAYSDSSDFAANIELIPCPPSDKPRPEACQPLHKVATPNQKSVAEVAAFLQVPEAQVLKTLFLNGEQGLIAVLLRGDHELNKVKAEKIPGVRLPLRLAEAAEIQTVIGAGLGSLGPVGVMLPIFADHAVAAMADFICGANADGFHWTGVNFGRDLPEPIFLDLRNICEGEPSPDGHGKLVFARGIEVGHIFQLGKKYSAALNAGVLDEQGQRQIMTMGCYGIGVSRIVAAAIEQHHDAQGICWPLALAPFPVVIAPIAYDKSAAVRELADQLYEQYQAAGIEVLLDDRALRPGAMFADLDLIGIPYRVVLSDKLLANNEVELKVRRESSPQVLPLSALTDFLRQAL
jgi:prolyl-tRNA synthetase